MSGTLRRYADLDAAAEFARRYVPGSGPVELLALGEGLVNHSYRVARDNALYALRIGTAGLPGDRQPAADWLLGLDPPWEARVLAAAAAVRLGPQVVLHAPQVGVLVTRWVAGNSWDVAQTRTPVNLSRMASLLRRVHALEVPPPRRKSTAAGWIRRYETALDQQAGIVRARSLPLREAALEWQRLAAGVPQPQPVLCHSDLHAFNVLDAGPELRLLDWEYAHVADPSWDTAAWISNNDLSEDASVDFLAAYWGSTPSPAQLSRQRFVCWAFDYVCLLWSELYLGLRGPASQVDARAQLLAARLTSLAWS